MKYLKSPLNYTGGKYKLLGSILALLPPRINVFVDLFAGGLNVGINVNANLIMVNDQITYLIELYEYLATHEIDLVFQEIQTRITKYQLSKTNGDGYNALKRDYNQTKDILDFLVITFYSFNHQIRFNNPHEFNIPFGRNRSNYNARIETNLIQFCHALQSKKMQFFHDDFMNLDLSNLSTNDLVYCDPPYLISNGSYNDGKRGFKNWTLKEEQQLLSLLDELDKRHVKFMLSNVFYHKGLANDLLIAWAQKYHIHYLDKSYANCNYHIKNKDTQTVEVLITNY